MLQSYDRCVSARFDASRREKKALNPCRDKNAFQGAYRSWLGRGGGLLCDTRSEIRLGGGTGEMRARITDERGKEGGGGGAKHRIALRAR